nr:site-specific DNA-methyltransferase [Salinicoccus luteus]
MDAVVTSPPYDKLRTYTDEFANWNFEKFKNIAEELYRVLKPGGVVAWVVGDATVNGEKTLTSYKQAIYFQEIGFKVYDVIIYEKTGSGPPHKNRYFNVFEYIFVLSKGNPKTINLLKDKPNKWAGQETYGVVTRREADGTLTKKTKKVINKFGIRTNIWKYKNGRGQTTRDLIAHGHPAIMPEKLVEDVLNSWTQPGDVVLDPFGGSGTTAKVAFLLDRKYIYIEQVQEYYNLAKERMKNYDE